MCVGSELSRGCQAASAKHRVLGRPGAALPDTPAWERYQLHNAANLYHVQHALGLTPATTRKYPVAWVGGCTLYEVAKLQAAGSFGFWRELPSDHCGEDVLVQQRVLACYGGWGLIPSGVYHQELPATVPSREVNVPRVLEVTPDPAFVSYEAQDFGYQAG